MSRSDPSTPRAPSACATLDEARQEIDRIDAALLAVLAERQRYVEAIAALKDPNAPVRDPVRVEAIIARQRAAAREAGCDPDSIEAVWRALLEAAAVLQDKLRAGRGDDAA